MSNDQNRTPAGDEALGWPDQDQQPDADQSSTSRPTSPATGAASAAAARAAYADAGKSAPRTEPSDVPQDEAPSIEEEPVIDPGDPRDDVDAAEFEPTSETAGEPATLDGDALLAAERLADYQRLNAEYVNYKRRVDRERAEDRKRAVASVVESLLPVLDEIHLAREHGELGEGTPFAKIAGKFEGILNKHGVSVFGEVGETFDPMVHEALMHTTAELPEGTTETTVVMVMQPGYRIDERVVRPARVSVADPA